MYVNILKMQKKEEEHTSNSCMCVCACILVIDADLSFILVKKEWEKGRSLFCNGLLFKSMERQMIWLSNREIYALFVI